MKTWVKVVIAVVVLFGAYRTYRRWRSDQMFARRQILQDRRFGLKPRDFNATDDPDATIVLKSLHPGTVQDEKNLKGKTLWVSAGGQMDMYPFNGKSVDFFHSAGRLLGADKIVVKDAVEQVARHIGGSQFPDADAEVLLIFVRPDDPRNPAKEYAVAVGDREGQDYSILTDQLFFYDDPHTLYSHWGPAVWKAIDDHTAVLGMTERQLQLALGTVNTPRADMMGDRTVEFEDQGRPKLVTFVHGKASEIRDEGR